MVCVIYIVIRCGDDEGLMWFDIVDMSVLWFFGLVDEIDGLVC